MPIDEARALMRLLYDDFACHCAPEHLASSLQRVLDRLEQHALSKPTVELLPLPTGPKDLQRLKRLFRYNVYRQHYVGSSPVVDEVLQGPLRDQLKANPRWLDEGLARIQAELEAQPRYVYASRDRDVAWDGTPLDAEARDLRAVAPEGW